MTGGSFGPEAGLAGTIVLLSAILLLLKSRLIVPAAGTLQLRPLAEERVRNERLI